MVVGLKRYQQMGDLHFITFCCYRRRAYLKTAEVRAYLRTLERIRCRYDFEVVGYVVMPEHVHLLVSEPGKGALVVSIQALKLSVARRSEHSPFWQARYYDFNVFTEGKRVEKLDYPTGEPLNLA